MSRKRITSARACKFEAVTIYVDDYVVVYVVC